MRLMDEDLSLCMGRKHYVVVINSKNSAFVPRLIEDVSTDSALRDQSGFISLQSKLHFVCFSCYTDGNLVKRCINLQVKLWRLVALGEKSLG